MKKIMFAAALAAGSFGILKAQNNLQIGANLGPTMGLSIKYNLDAAQAFEGIAGYNINHEGPSFKFMYQYHIPLVDALKLYMGGGLHIGGYHVGNRHVGKHYYDDGDFAFGLVPTIGLEYPIKTAPVTFAFGYEPAINFTTCDTWNDIAFKVRFRF